MPLISRDTAAADQLVYAWPFPIGPEPIEIACGEEEVVVMCPAWTLGDRLGPGRHRWRTPDPAKPVNAYFVLLAPVEVAFDMLTTFVVPTSQQPVRLRAQGSVLARCVDPATLVAQFVGLPFDHVDAGVRRSVSISVERLLARVLVRRVIASGSPIGVTDPSMLPSIVDELTAYNPAAGAVNGVTFVRFNQLLIQADDGGVGGGVWGAQPGWQHRSDPNLMHQSYSTGAYGAFGGDSVQTANPYAAQQAYGGYASAPEQPAYHTGAFAAGSTPPAPPAAASGVGAAPALMPMPDAPAPGVVSGEIGSGRRKSLAPGTMSVTPEGALFATGARVLVPSSDGLLHASTVRQHQQGYYEVEIGSTGQTVWVPASQVIADK